MSGDRKVVPNGSGAVTSIPSLVRDQSIGPISAAATVATEYDPTFFTRSPTAYDEITLCLPFNVCDEDEAVRMLVRDRRRKVRLFQQKQQQQSDAGAADTKSDDPAADAATLPPVSASPPLTKQSSAMTTAALSLTAKMEILRRRKANAKPACFFLPADDVTHDLTEHFRCFIGVEPLSVVWGTDRFGRPTRLGAAPATQTVMERYVEHCRHYAQPPATSSAPPASPALNNLAICYLMGFGVERDLKRVQSLLEAAMKGGSAAASNNHAVCLALGVYDGVSSPKLCFAVLDELVTRLERTLSAPATVDGDSKSVPAPIADASALACARSALPIALVNLGSSYQAAIGTPQNFDVALELYRRAIRFSQPPPTTSAAAAAATVAAAALSSPSKHSRSALQAAQLHTGGHVRAYALLGLMYEHGFGALPRSETFCEEMYLVAANRGYCYSQRELGALYGRPTSDAVGSGSNFRRDERKSFYWYQRASDQGFTETQVRLGEMYESGIGVEWNERKAFEMYELAASHGSKEMRREGIMMMAYSYRNGVGVTADSQKVLELYELGAEYGSPEAMTVLAEMMNANTPTMHGMKADLWRKVVPVDEGKALSWFQKAASNDDPQAKLQLAYFYLMGHAGLGVKKDVMKACELIADADFLSLDDGTGAPGGDGSELDTDVLTAHLQCREWSVQSALAASPPLSRTISGSSRDPGEIVSVLGTFFGSGAFVGTQSGEKAFHCYLIAADEFNYVPAMLSVGLAYEYGRGVPVSETKAFFWYEKAAKSGSGAAQFQLAECYDTGLGCEKSRANSIEWLKKSAKSGHATAQNNLAVKFETGRGVEQDMIKAFYWYKEAANNGSSCAQHNVYLCYLDGLGVTKDLAEAQRWLERSAKSGFLSAKRKIGDQYKTSARAAYHLSTEFALIGKNGGGRMGYVDAEPDPHTIAAAKIDEKREISSAAAAANPPLPFSSSPFASVDSMVVHAATGDLYVADRKLLTIWKCTLPVPRDQLPLAFNAYFPEPISRLICSYFRLDPVVTRYARLPTECQFGGPNSLTIDQTSGILYLADYARHCIRKIAPPQPPTQAGSSGDAALAVVSIFAGSTTGQAGKLDSTRLKSRFRHPYSVLCDRFGNLIVDDAGNRTVRKLATSTNVVRDGDADTQTVGPATASGTAPAAASGTVPPPLMKRQSSVDGDTGYVSTLADLSTDKTRLHARLSGGAASAAAMGDDDKDGGDDETDSNSSTTNSVRAVRASVDRFTACAIDLDTTLVYGYNSMVEDGLVLLSSNGDVSSSEWSVGFRAVRALTLLPNHSSSAHRHAKTKDVLISDGPYLLRLTGVVSPSPTETASGSGSTLVVSGGSFGAVGAGVDISCFAAPAYKFDDAVIRCLAVDYGASAATASGGAAGSGAPAASSGGSSATASSAGILYIGVLGERDINLFKIPLDTPPRTVSQLPYEPASAPAAAAASTATPANAAASGLGDHKDPAPTAIAAASTTNANERRNGTNGVNGRTAQLWTAVDAWLQAAANGTDSEATTEAAAAAVAALAAAARSNGDTLGGPPDPHL